MPFKSNVYQLGSSSDIARRRFLFLEKRFLKDDTLRKMYIEFIDIEYINLGHMSPVSFHKLNSSHYIIPHHCVLHPQISSTKLRVVFDASRRTSTNISLNETLMVGPTIQQDLITTIFAFRLNKFALSDDIWKMYRQYLLDESDVNDPLKLYQLNTVTYGTSAAPFLAIRSYLYFLLQTSIKLPFQLALKFSDKRNLK